MTNSKNLVLSMAAQSIKQETGLDFSGCLQILAVRLKGKSINELVSEIKNQQEDEKDYKQP